MREIPLSRMSGMLFTFQSQDEASDQDAKFKYAGVIRF